MNRYVGIGENLADHLLDFLSEIMSSVQRQVAIQGDVEIDEKIGTRMPNTHGMTIEDLVHGFHSFFDLLRGPGR